MILIIAGGRDYELTRQDFDKLDDIQNVTEVVSGCARGVDKCGEVWAEVNKIPVKRFPADWDLYGQVAGFKRNVQMALYADALAVFPGGRGTDHMAKTAKAHGLQIYDFRDNQLL